MMHPIMDREGCRENTIYFNLGGGSIQSESTLTYVGQDLLIPMWSRQRSSQHCQMPSVDQWKVKTFSQGLTGPNGPH